MEADIPWVVSLSYQNVWCKIKLWDPKAVNLRIYLLCFWRACLFYLISHLEETATICQLVLKHIQHYISYLEPALFTANYTLDVLPLWARPLGAGEKPLPTQQQNVLEILIAYTFPAQHFKLAFQIFSPQIIQHKKCFFNAMLILLI